MHELVRCKHERRCSRTFGVDVSFRDVTIKIPDRGCEQGCEWRHAPEAWAEIWEKSVSWILAWKEESWLSGLVVARRICALRALHVSWVESWRYKSSQHRRIVSLSPYVEKRFNSEVIKSFVPELRSRKCFFVFRDSYVFYIWVMNILCLFHVFMYGYVTVVVPDRVPSIGQIELFDHLNVCKKSTDAGLLVLHCNTWNRLTV